MKPSIPIIILCGGRGKRLGKLSRKIPKALVKVGNKSLLKLKLNFYRLSGIKKFFVCIGYKGDLIKKHLSNYSNVVFSNSGERAGILKRIYDVLKKIKQPSIISYGDTLAKINLKKLYNFHVKSKAIITIVVSPVKNPFGIVEWDSREKVKQFVEKPTLNHFIGYAVINPGIFKFINKKIINMSDGMGLVKAIQSLTKKRKVNVFKFDGLQFTVNSVKDLREANIRFNKYFTLNETFK
tara:strand:+ start:248 stop:961 length:714 start_codon:yes stop_codon:yes gene_type:complete